ncbi:hypothetical protein JCM10450v2_008405 [Rhodotorula kratochvilovae]
MTDPPAPFEPPLSTVARLAATPAPRPTLASRSVPSDRPHVADVPLAPDAQERFYALHDALLEASAARADTVEELQAEVDDAERDDEERRVAEEDDAALASSSAHSSDVPSDSAPRPRPAADAAQSTDSDAEVAAALTAQKRGWAALASAEGMLAGATLPLPEGADKPALEERRDEDADAEENGEDGGPDVDGEPVALDAGGAVVTQLPAAQMPSDAPAKRRRATRSAQEPTDSEADKTSHTRAFLQYWREHVSKLHPPHAWFHAAPAPSPSSAPLIGCTLTLSLPDGFKLVFSVPSAHPSRKAARDAAYALAWEAGAHEDARAAREARGWEAEREEKRRERERLTESVGGEKPWEKLKSEGERWMAAPVKWEFEEDKLNTTHACRLTVAVSPSSTLTFLTPTTYANHRDAKDAAARLALEAGVPAQYEAAFKERLNRESGGIIKFGAGAGAAGAADGGDAEMADVQHDPVLLLQAEVKNAFGGVNKYVEWTHTHAAPENGSMTSAQSLLSCTFTLTFPPTPLVPNPPARFTVSVPAHFHTKQHARISCAALAFKEGVRERLRPYQDERAEELRRRKEDREKREREKREGREKGVRAVPAAGTVPYEELDKLDNPAAYLNLSAQQWTGNSSPLKFEYQTSELPGVPGKQHGCTLTVFVDRNFSKSYAVVPSPATPSRAAAKEAAIRLALRERVLDLLKPADFDADAKAAGKGVKRARKEREREGGKSAGSSAESERGGGGGGGAGAERAALFASPWGAAPATAPVTATAPAQGQSAVAFLDEVCLAHLGAGGLPTYDVQQSASTGLLGATLRLQLPAALGPVREQAYAAAPVQKSRADAQEAAAGEALRGGIVGLLRAVRGAQEGDGGSAASVNSRAAAVSTSATGAAATGAGGAAHDGVGREGKKRGREEGGEEERVEEGYDGGAGDAVYQLREGCASVHEGEEAMLPRYRVVQTGSAFGASVVVTLDKLTSASRAFGVPTTFSSRDAACNAAASAALSAGALELVRSRNMPPPVPSAAAGSAPKPRRGKQQPAPRSPEEQASLRRSAYGGFGAATAATVAAALEKEQAREREKARKEERGRFERNPLLHPPTPPARANAPQLLPTSAAAGAPRPAGAVGAAAVVDGPAVHQLREYCLAHALPIPTLQHEPVPSGTAHRVWVVVRGLRFELPSVPGTASAARDRLAARVLKHLRAEEAKQGAGNA